MKQDSSLCIDGFAEDFIRKFHDIRYMLTNINIVSDDEDVYDQAS